MRVGSWHKNVNLKETVQLCIVQNSHKKGSKLGRNYCVLKCLTRASENDSDITMSTFDLLTCVIKERCQTGGFRESNGRQVIVSSCWQRGDRGLQAGLIRRGSKPPELPLTMQTTLHTVTQSTGPDNLPKNNTNTKMMISNSEHIISTKLLIAIKWDALIFKFCVSFDLG